MADEAAIEQEIQDKGLTAPRLSPEAVDRIILSECYLSGSELLPTIEVLPDDHRTDRVRRTVEAVGRMTVCILVLQNGFTVVGESACVDARNFDLEIGKKIARQNAREKIWPLLGYELKSRLVEAGAKS